MTAELTAFAVLSFVSCITPGPNNALAAATGARFGWSAGIVSAWGVSVGCTALILLAAMGVAGAIAATPWLARVLAVASAAYLIWLAWCLLRGGGGPRREAARPPRFVETVAFQFINPKGWAMALAGTTLVLAPADARAWRLVAMCGVQAVMCFGSVMAWVTLGARLQRWLDDARHRRIFNAAMAASLAVCAWMALAPAFQTSIN